MITIIAAWLFVGMITGILIGFLIAEQDQKKSVFNEFESLIDGAAE